VDFIELGDEAGTASAVNDHCAGLGDEALDAVQLFNRNDRHGFIEAIDLVSIEYRSRPGE
jgi:hypothetical protein